ncbi:MAG: ParB/RepB/Spo0J family partition protein [Candidatus Omnitrophica bacterium]|nr:ParB/RepB/Spo0J family partition protein [Candidatus Omnitrophota bacterium]
MEKKKGLGKGLAALIPQKLESETRAPFVEVEISKIKLNPLQPRKDFSVERIEDLKNSIQQEGLLQPVVVARQGETYVLIAGERRLRAVKKLGWQKIPAVILDSVRDAEFLRKSLVENIQRANLNPIEEATAYKRLVDEYGYSLERLAKEVGKDFSTISNTIRLLNLPPDIQERLKNGDITAGHARALLMLKDEKEMRALLEEIKEKKLSVRKAEEKARRAKKASKTSLLDPNIIDIIDKLQRRLGTRVHILKTRKGGKVEIQFLNEEDLQRILNIICGEEM